MSGVAKAGRFSGDHGWPVLGVSPRQESETIPACPAPTYRRALIRVQGAAFGRIPKSGEPELGEPLPKVLQERSACPYILEAHYTGKRAGRPQKWRRFFRWWNCFWQEYRNQESCRRLNVPLKEYLAAALPGLNRRTLSGVANLTPARWSTDRL